VCEFSHHGRHGCSLREEAVGPEGQREVPASLGFILRDAAKDARVHVASNDAAVLSCHVLRRNIHFRDTSAVQSHTTSLKHLAEAALQ